MQLGEVSQNGEVLRDDVASGDEEKVAQVLVLWFGRGRAGQSPGPAVDMSKHLDLGD